MLSLLRLVVGAVHTTPDEKQLAAIRQGLGHRPSQVAAIHSSGPHQRRPTIGLAKQQLRLAARRENMNVRRAMIVEEDDETQISGTVDGRHLKITHLMGYSRAHPKG
jgi:hypothetical protein